ncbi:FMN-binding protein [Patescibacteria group bacterium]|nr:FMN-binding protein [Patescibacteria group bacterium]
MKKYLQITVVLTIFGLLVFLRQVWGKEDMSVPTPTSQPQVQTPTPLPSSAAQIHVTAQPTVQPTTASTAQPTATPNMPMMQTGKYKNGTYTGSVADAFYGNLQVQAVISGGRITDVIFLQYPNDNSTSQYVNSQADPMLKQEAIQAQSAQVDIISGASASSQAFQQSLADALAQAK